MGTYWDPTKNLKTGDRDLRETGTLKSKTLYHGGAGKAVPNVTLEKLYNSMYKFTFIYVLAQNVAEFRKQNFRRFNFI